MSVLAQLGWPIKGTESVLTKDYGGAASWNRLRPTDKADQIFNAFLTTKPEGSGMGLAISRSIIESHGGHLSAIDNSGRGATFYFTLPTAAQTVQLPATGT